MQPDFVQHLRSHGYRATPGRVELLKLLWRMKQPLTVGEIAKKLSLNEVTLYRALDEFARAGLVLRGIGSGDLRASRFSFASHAHHHHLVCVECGFIKQCAHCA
jgi:Fe2+ or Zn2+ uptake regulation protein